MLDGHRTTIGRPVRYGHLIRLTLNGNNTTRVGSEETLLVFVIFPVKARGLLDESFDSMLLKRCVPVRGVRSVATPPQCLSVTPATKYYS
jgi:hypothetical protein